MQLHLGCGADTCRVRAAVVATSHLVLDPRELRCLPAAHCFSAAAMPSDDRDEIELQDILETVESRLRDHERHGWRRTVPRSRVYATVLLAVILSARESHRIPATLDRAAILDTIFDGTEPATPGDQRRPIEDAIRTHTVHAN